MQAATELYWSLEGRESKRGCVCTKMPSCCHTVTTTREEEVAKLEKHLMLLRQEYVKLQKKLTETERKCALLAAQSNKENASDSFITRLLSIVAELYEQEQYR
ncbi:rabankyrin-5-like [Sceloporus undulatus]|uniref:rabankyrin-5-like n=1 Tax=Sceloporus undulatus TaxID=8520 RepID=UPI001C4DB98F|nr:rabankyrin-5-like [Sceloporus undulatus]